MPRQGWNSICKAFCHKNCCKLLFHTKMLHSAFFFFNHLPHLICITEKRKRGYSSKTCPLFSTKLMLLCEATKRSLPILFVQHWLCHISQPASPPTPQSPTATAKSCRHHNCHCCFTEKGLRGEHPMAMGNNTASGITPSCHHTHPGSFFLPCHFHLLSLSRGFWVHARWDFLQWPEESQPPLTSSHGWYLSE